jgi:pectin methylesterase-like acyl-CoA thioesterase
VNVGSATYNGTAGASVGTTTSITAGPTPSSPVYAASGTEVTFTVQVSAASGSNAPTGTVTYAVVGPNSYSGSGSATFVSSSSTTSTYTIPLSGIVAGNGYSITATYSGTTGFTGSGPTSGTTFNVSKATTSTSWTPGASTLQVSAPIGASILNATCTGSPNYYITYTATPSGGSAQNVDAATYLTMSGSPYSLVATCTPADTTDYTTTTAVMSSLTVSQATTTAPIGATQYLVAASGGNYTSVQAAITALGASGGNVYLAPGTYTERVTVVQPNVALRGLGGNAQNVVITHEAGAFSASGNSGYAGEFTTALTNGYQLASGSSTFSGDQGSATVNITKGINATISGSTTYYPYNFYAENLSINNTWNTDTTTTTTTYNVSSACTASAGTAQTYSALYNAGTECASQALAIWDTGDQSVFNNVYTGSLQDTVYAGSGGCGSPCTVGREYWYHGKITGDVDYIFGDAAAVFDHMNIYSAYHSTVTGTVTIEAQNKQVATGSGSDYLSGYVFNYDTLTSQSSGMTGLYFGRPYGAYSTTALISCSIDQVNASGWSPWSGNNNLSTSTYLEYNDLAYTDPSNGSADINGVIYTGTGGSSGSGVSGTRETTSTNPGTNEATNNPPTSMSLVQSSQYQPYNFLNTKVGSGGVGTLGSGSSANWNPLTAIASDENGFTNSATTSYTIAYGNSITILMRPNTPGAGVIPTGTYTLKDGSTTVASGSLDATGEAYYTSSSLGAGTHSFTWVYGGDSNFAGSTTSTPVTVTVGATLWVVNSNGTLSKLNTAGTAISGGSGYSGSSNLSSGSQGGTAQDSSGNMWTVDSGGNALVEFNSTGSSSTSYSSGGGLNAPVGVAVDGAGLIWVANSGNNSVSLFNPSGAGTWVSASTGLTSNTGNGSSMLSGPTGLAVDSAGAVWVTNGSNNSVTQIVGVGTPVVVPTVNAVSNNTLGVKP